MGPAPGRDSLQSAAARPPGRGEVSVGASRSAGSRRAQRALEVLTGGLTWAILTSPLWGAILAPGKLVWFLLLFNGYWVYKSANMAISAMIGYRRMVAGQKTDWLGAIQGIAGWDRINHLVMVPTYREP